MVSVGSTLWSALRRECRLKLQHSMALISPSLVLVMVTRFSFRQMAKFSLQEAIEISSLALVKDLRAQIHQCLFKLSITAL